MVSETERIWAIAQQHQVSPRTAAYVHALSRLGDALNAKGTRADYASPPAQPPPRGTNS
jgi:glutamate dehydrogenase (NADP+)